MCNVCSLTIEEAGGYRVTFTGDSVEAVVAAFLSELNKADRIAAIRAEGINATSNEDELCDRAE